MISVLLFLTIILWGSYNLFFKTIGTGTNYFLSLMIAGLSMSALFLPFVLTAAVNNKIVFDSRGLIFSAIMGLLLGGGSITFYYAIKFGTNLSIGIPIYTVGALLLGVAGGIFLFHETLTLKAIVGIFLGVISIVLLTLR
ncbi:hypothetical protein KA107_02420 [Candidatus Pacearchaeota archaeon]|nr:hypothetical protein [Candidatus Pacearchaeota archaeon]